MLTQTMPALARALTGVMPEAAIRQVMQALGNCNQPLEHRGPVSFRPSDQFRQTGAGVYQGGAWNPGDYQQLIDAPNAINNRGFIDTPYTQNRWGDSSHQTTNNNFLGDNFLFNTNATLAANFFQSFVMLGQPGAVGIFPFQPAFNFQFTAPSLSFGDGSSYYGRDGVDGAAGLSGVNGSPGANGIDGARGRDGFGIIGPAGPPGGAGQAGAAGRDGRVGFDGLPGLPGRQGRPGRDGIGGGYRVVAGLREIQRIPMQKTIAGTEEVELTWPEYEFDAENCKISLTNTPTDKITIPTISASSFIYELDTLGLPRLAQKPNFP